MKVSEQNKQGIMLKEREFNPCPDSIFQSDIDVFFLTINSVGSLSEAIESIAKAYDFVDTEPKLRIEKNSQNIFENIEKGYKSLILAFEDPHPIGYSLENLRAFYELGIRVIQLTLNEANYIGTGCLEKGSGGLTKFGEEMIVEMNRLGIVIDLSHCNDLTTEQAIEKSGKPVIFSHANVKSLTNNLRNKSDKLIKLLARNGGVIGITPWSPLSWSGVEDKPSSLDDYLNHVEYVINLVGIDHVGIDLNGMGSHIMKLANPPSNSRAIDQVLKYKELIADYHQYVGTDTELQHVLGFEGPEDTDNLIVGMKKRGLTNSDIHKFLSGNMIRVLMDQG